MIKRPSDVISGNPDRRLIETIPADVTLGSVLFSCRDRSTKEQLDAVGNNPVPYYFFALLGSYIVFGVLTFALQRSGTPLSNEGTWILLGFLGVLACGCTYKLISRRPRTSSLMLCERGMQFKKIAVHYDELESLRIGREYSKLESAIHAVNRFFAPFRPVNAMAERMAEEHRRNSVNFVFKTGKTKSLNGVLTYPLPEDLKLFFDRLRALHPELVKGSLPALKPAVAMPEVEDLPFKMTPV